MRGIYLTGTVLVCMFLASAGSNGFGQIRNNQAPPKSLVVIDTTDKENVRGNVSFAYAWGEQLRYPLKYTRGLSKLTEAMKKWTKISVRLEEHLLLSSERLLEMPFVFVTTEDMFELTPTERKNVTRFFEKGGVMLLDDTSPRSDFSAAEATLKKMILDTIPNARFQIIPNSHPLYHCFFDFDDGPPYGDEVGTSMGFMSKPVFYLEGVWYKNRLVAIYSNKGYIRRWSDNSDSDPQLKMGVNMVVFALTQEGGIAEIVR